jgi:hypothetical protein
MDWARTADTVSARGLARGGEAATCTEMARLGTGTTWRGKLEAKRDSISACTEIRRWQELGIPTLRGHTVRARSC